MQNGKTLKVTTNRFSAVLIILFIILDVICDNIILSNFHVDTSYSECLLFIGFLCLQIIASPIQAGLLDFYGKRKSLIFSLSFTLLSLATLLIYSSESFPYFVILAFSSIIKGTFGNTIPIIWSIIGETKSKNERFFFAISEASYAIGFLVLLGINRILNISKPIAFLIFIFTILIFLCSKNFKNKKKKESFYKHVIEEKKLITNDLKNHKLALLFKSFFLWEISLYSILILYADFRSQNIPYVAIFMMIGYLIGSGIMKFLKNISNKKMIKCGYMISICSLLPYIVTSAIFKNFNYLLVGGFFFHAIGNAILCPTLLSLISEGSEHSQKNKRFGLLESFDTLALLISSGIIFSYRKFELPINFLVYISFLTMLISWWPYNKFAKSQSAII